MKRLLGAALLVAVGVGGVGCGSSRPHNCMVIPAQIELLQERREAMLNQLEGIATRVDRQASTLATVRERYEKLEAEKALLDSLAASEPAQPGTGSTGGR